MRDMRSKVVSRSECVDHSEDGNSCAVGNFARREQFHTQQRKPSCVLSSSLLMLSVLTLSAEVSLAQDVSVRYNQTIDSTALHAVATERSVLSTYTQLMDNSTNITDGNNSAGGVTFVFALLLWIVAAIICVYIVIEAPRAYISRMRLRARLQELPQINQGGDAGNNQQEIPGVPNGRAVVGHRDPDDRPGEIMELHEEQWGWGHLPAEIIPMVIMGGAQRAEEGEEEEEEEDEV